MNFRATEDELLRSNVVIDDKIVRVAGGGYVGVLSVYRELHCLVSHTLSRQAGRAENLSGSITEVDFEVSRHQALCYMLLTYPEHTTTQR